MTASVPEGFREAGIESGGLPGGVIDPKPHRSPTAVIDTNPHRFPETVTGIDPHRFPEGGS